MKHLKYFMACMAIFLMLIVGCWDSLEDEAQIIEVEKRISDDDQYEDFNVISDHREVQKVKNILDDITWENAKVLMIRSADYRFVFQFKNPEIEAKAALYELWISPRKDSVELVEGERKYIQLDKKTSAQLFEILTGEKLSDLN